MENKKIKELRKKIDFIDKKILQLLKERKKLAEKIIKIKIRKGIKITDKKREKEIIERLIKQTKDKILKKYIPSIYKIIFKISKEKFNKNI
jgi:chorismate mutase